MKKTPLTVRRCPRKVHQALKESAAANRRSVNNEALVWLEDRAKRKRKVVTGKDAARILRKAWKVMTPQEHLEMAGDIEAYIKKVRGERFH